MGISGYWKRFNWKRDLIQRLGDNGNVTISCQLVGISRKCAYLQKRKDTDFSDRWDEAVLSVKKKGYMSPSR